MARLQHGAKILQKNLTPRVGRTSVTDDGWNCNDQYEFNIVTFG